MNDKYKWHYNDKEFLEFAQNHVKEFQESFNYKSYITPHDDMRELLGRIIEEFQYLESCIKHLIEIAIENKIYNGKNNLNFDNYVPATRIINELKNCLIDEKIAKELIVLIKFRNYIIHEHYLNDNSKEIEKKFPHFLFMIFEANDYISNVTNRIIGGATHIPNIFEVKVKK